MVSHFAKLSILLGAIVIVGFACPKDVTKTSQEPTTVETSEIEKDVTKKTAEEISKDSAEKEPVEYELEGFLEDVTGGEGSGTVVADVIGGVYTVIAKMEGIPDPQGSDFYEGWVVRSSPLSVISTGVTEKQDGMWMNTFKSAEDLTDHLLYVLTLEPDDGDPAPAEHILEGTMSTK